jgi:hypothetical protein
MYSAIVLDEKSHLKLVDWANDNIKVGGVKLPILVQREGWEMVCHHMTIKFPGTPEFVKPYLDSVQKLEVISVSVSDKVIAVRVVGFHSENKIPHITIAVNVKDGGKPAMSNQLKSWTSVIPVVKLTGIVKEIP